MTFSSSEAPSPLMVIGAGLTGLCAALAWTLKRPQEPAVLLESQTHVGGYVTTWSRRGYAFDSTQMVPNIGPLLRLLGVELELRPFPCCLQVLRVDPRSGERRSFSVPTAQDALLAAVQADFPAQAPRFRRFLLEARSLYQQLTRLRLEPGIGDILSMFFQAPGVIRHGSSTFDAWFRRFGIDDPMLLEVVGAFVEMSALPADEVHALVPISVLCSLLDGACRPAGAFSELPAALEARLIALGGQVRTSSRVTRILVEGGHVQGVELSSGQRLAARRVITTIDPTVAMRELVGIDPLRELDPGFARKVEGLRMSWSSFNLNLGLDAPLDVPALDPGAGYTVLTTGGATLRSAFSACARGESELGLDRFHLGLVQSRAPGPPSLTVRLYPLAMGSWATMRREDPVRYRAEKQRIGSLIEDILEKHLIPDLRRHVVVRDTSSPATYARYSGSPSGAIYDMAPTVANFGRTRLPMRTPVKNLLQPRFVHGVLGAMLSGLQAADLLLDGAWMSGRAMPEPGSS